YGAATTPHNTLSLHDALPISSGTYTADGKFTPKAQDPVYSSTGTIYREPEPRRDTRDIYSQLTQSLQEYSYPYEQLMRDTLASRSEEHTSELQSRENLVCRLL